MTDDVKAAMERYRNDIYEACTKEEWNDWFLPDRMRSDLQTLADAFLELHPEDDHAD